MPELPSNTPLTNLTFNNNSPSRNYNGVWEFFAAILHDIVDSNVSNSPLLASSFSAPSYEPYNLADFTNTDGKKVLVTHAPGWEDPRNNLSYEVSDTVDSVGVVFSIYLRTAYSENSQLEMGEIISLLEKGLTNPKMNTSCKMLVELNLSTPKQYLFESNLNSNLVLSRSVNNQKYAETNYTYGALEIMFYCGWREPDHV